MPALGEGFDLAVLCQADPERARVLERAPHQAVVLHPVSVVGEQGHAELGHLGDRCQLLASPALGDRTGDPYLAEAVASELQHLPNGGRSVDRRFGVGHRHDRGVPAERRCPRAGLHRLRLLLPRLPQVGVEVHQTRCDHGAGGVQHVRSGELGADGLDGAVRSDHDITGTLAVRVDDPPSLDHDLRHRVRLPR